MNNVIRSAVLLTALVGIGGALAAWKFGADGQAAAAQPEPAEAVSAAPAVAREHRAATTAIGTVLALRSVTLRNELPGTVRQVNLQPGAVVEAGTVLVAMDVSVEQADLKAQEAQLALANATLQRLERLRGFDAISEIDLDKAKAERDVAAAQVARTQALIARKTIRVPFRARVGLANLHPGQYLNEGTEITTLQGVDEALDVDFAVPQAVAAALKPGDRVDVFAGTEAGAKARAIPARVAAVDARVDPATRNSAVRARIQLGKDAAALAPLPAPGSSVRVSVGVGESAPAVAIPATALRKGPAGDHVFVLAEGADKQLRVHQRPVQVGAMLGDEVLVTAGLKAGERVATSGSFKLRDAALVAVTGAETRTSSAKANAATGG
jgi:membrane fusion protein (multidrug efflux system)